MSTPKFAPGPWVVDWDDFVVRAKSPIDGRMVPVARLYGVGDDGSDVPANARLIAAAPDMYEALKSLIQDCETANARWVDQVGIGAIDINVLSRARAALAKAEGKL